MFTTEDQSLRSHAVLPGALSLTADRVWLLREGVGAGGAGGEGGRGAGKDVCCTLNAHGATLRAGELGLNGGE